MTTLLLDHCIWRPTADALRDAGFTCVSLRELGRAEARNGEVLALATHRRILLLTRDADFTDLNRYPVGRQTGTIYLRITPRTMAAVHQMLIEALHHTPLRRLRGALLIVEPNGYRLRRPWK